MIFHGGVIYIYMAFLNMQVVLFKAKMGTMKISQLDFEAICTRGLCAWMDNDPSGCRCLLLGNQKGSTCMPIMAIRVVEFSNGEVQN